MIKRIVTENDLRLLYNSFKEYSKTNKINHFGDAKYDADLLFAAWSDQNLLINKTVLYASIENNIVDSFCWFCIDFDLRIGKKVASLYIWISKDNKNGIKCFNECLNCLKRKEIKFVEVGFSCSSPSYDRLYKYLSRKGFKKEYLTMYNKI